MAAPDPKLQQKKESTPEIPELKTESLIQQQPNLRNFDDLTEPEQQEVEEKLNNVKKFFFTHFEPKSLEEGLFQKPVSVGEPPIPPSQPPADLTESFFGKVGKPITVASENIYQKRLAQEKELSVYQKQLYGAQYFEQTLDLYHSQFANFMLNEASMELLYSALGPVGALFRTVHHKKIAWKFAWSKNLLNPASIFYYLKTLPELKAFHVLKDPVKKTVGILARSNNPLFSAYHYHDIRWNNATGQWEPGEATIYGFTPFIAISKGAEKLS